MNCKKCLIGELILISINYEFNLYVYKCTKCEELIILNESCKEISYIEFIKVTKGK